MKILRRESSVKWAMREESENANDSGWRLYSEDDTPEFLESPSSMRIVNFNAVGELFPIIYLLPASRFGIHAGERRQRRLAPLVRLQHP